MTKMMILNEGAENVGQATVGEHTFELFNEFIYLGTLSPLRATQQLKYRGYFWKQMPI